MMSWFSQHDVICQIQQILLENWPEPDLVGFLKNDWIPDLREPAPKSSSALIYTVSKKEF